MAINIRIKPNIRVKKTVFGLQFSTDPESQLYHEKRRSEKYWEKTLGAPYMGLEHMTLRLKVWRSTVWANRAHMLSTLIRKENCSLSRCFNTPLAWDW